MRHNAFDDWVAEAPARHLGAFALMIMVVMALILGGKG